MGERGGDLRIGKVCFEGRHTAPALKDHMDRLLGPPEDELVAGERGEGAFNSFAVFLMTGGAVVAEHPGRVEHDVRRRGEGRGMGGLGEDGGAQGQQRQAGKEAHHSHPFIARA